MSNRNGVWSLPAQYQAIADQDWTMAPGAPTGVSASAGNAQAEVSFTAPTFAGIPGTITQFKVTSSSGQTATGSASPITVTGLTNGSGVTFTAQAQNAIGLGKASDASSSVTPLAVVISGLFSTHLYLGNNTSTAINNGINLSGKGGLVWTKNRDDTQTHFISDTERGATKLLSPNNTDAQETQSSSLTSFNNNGFTVNNLYVNNNGDDYVSWTFRKEPKFFDIVTYTGNGTAGRTISHSLDSNVGMIIIKKTNASEDWSVWHRELHTNSSGETTQFIKLNSTAAAFPPSPTSSSSATSDVRSASSTTFTVGDDSRVNSNGDTYIAYLFAHNNNDGGFGSDSEDIIKCGATGAYTAGTPLAVNLGFEPQWILVKQYDGTDGWYITDVMRGMEVDEGAYLQPNSSNAETDSADYGVAAPTSTGFILDPGSSSLLASGNYIYMAIRRPDMSTPTSASDVFAINTTGTNDSPNNNFTVGFDPDLSLNTQTNGNQRYLVTRLLGNGTLKANDTTAVNKISSASFFGNPSGTIDLNTNFWGTASNVISWSWKRARGYFDVVAYTGTGSARTISHNLGAVPEMMWVKRRSGTRSWFVYHSALGNTGRIKLDTTDAGATGYGDWNSTTPTSSVFSVGSGTNTNGNGETYIAYLFATVAGVSKVGSYTANGSAQNIDCGFTNGTKWVMIRRSSGTGNWFLIDTTRGLVAGNDTLLELNTTSNQDSGYDDIDPLDAGFTITAYGGTAPYLNINGETYIFYAIAA